MVKSKEKVIQFIYSGPGGLGTYWKYWIQGDQESRYEHLVVFTGEQQLFDEYRLLCEARQIRYYFLHKTKAYDQALTTQIFRILQEEDPKNIILHQPTLVIPINRYCRRHHKRFIVVEHTQNAAKRVVDKLFSFVAALLARRVVLFYPSQLREAFGLLSPQIKSKAVIIPKGVDVDYYFPIVKEACSTVVSIGMQGRMDRSKDQATLIKAFSQLHRKYPQRELMLQLAGTGVLQAELQSLAEQEGVKSMVVFEGWLNGQEQRNFLQHTDIYVHATHGETVCYAIMEAQACGCPIIGANVAGVSEVLENGKFGLTYQPGDFMDLMAKLEQLIMDQELRKEMARRSRDVAVAQYSSLNMFLRYVELLEQKSA